MPKGTIVGIDIGSTKIATVVGQLQEGIIDIIGVGSANSLGVRKGMIVDLEETISSLSASLEEAERMSGVTINEAIVSVSGSHISSERARGVVAVSKADGEINELDVERVVDAARSVNTPPNREVIHSVPLGFTVDGQKGIKDPIGMTGVRLEVEANIITGSSSVLKNMTRGLNQAGVNVLEYVFSPIATARAITSKEQREIGVLMLDIGSQTTNFAVIEEDQLLATGSIPLGSGHITNDLAIGLRTSIDIAEKIKINLGQAMPAAVKQKTVSGKEYGYEDGDIDPTLVADITEARLNEILVMVKDQLRKVNKDSLLPAGAIVTGGGSLQSGLLGLIRETLKLPAAKGDIQSELSGMVDNVSSPDYATSIGLVLWALEANKDMPRPWFNWHAPDSLRDVVNKTKDIFKNLLP